MDTVDDQWENDLQPCQKQDGRVTRNHLQMGEGNMAKNFDKIVAWSFKKCEISEAMDWNEDDMLKERWWDSLCRWRWQSWSAVPRIFWAGGRIIAEQLQELFGDSDDEEEECLGFFNWESLETIGSFGSHQIQ